MQSLLNSVKCTVVQNLIAAANNTDQKSSVLDMSEFDGVMFVLPITVETSTGTATLDVHQNTANSTSGSAIITGMTATATSTGSNLAGTALVVDVARPLQRYVLARIRSGVANMTFGPCVAIQYAAHNKPTTQDALTIAASTSGVGS